MERHYQGAVELAAGIAAGRYSAQELLEMFLDRIGRFNPTLNAIVVFDTDAARERAKAADAARRAGTSWGPLHGVPITVKESFDLAGFPSTFGRGERRNHRAARDALAVERLKAAGAVVMGKTNVPKDLSDWQAFNVIYGATVNPWDHARTPGGSSGGASAALAAGLAALELGSDIGGSIRMPAHYCGIYGHKPSYGIVPMRGHAPADDMAAIDILVAGPLARRAADLEVALEVIAGADPEEEGGWRLDLPAEPRRRFRDFRIAVVTDDATFRVDADTRAALGAIADLLEREGARVVRDPKLPMPSHDMWLLYLTLLRSAMSSALSDADVAHHARLAAAAGAEAMDYASVIARAYTLSHRDWLKANDARQLLRRLWRAFFAEHDLVLAPMSATTAFPHVRGIAKEDQTMMVDGARRLASDTYFWIGIPALVPQLPATTVPAGIARDGLPIGIQIIGPEYRDRRCLALARLLETAHRGFVPPPLYP